jgi:putative ABC transport system ATP-binding protein
MKQQPDKRPVAQLIGVSKTLSGAQRATTVLNDVSFDAYPGELILLLGPSGSGKSTFLTILAGLQSPSAGEVKLFGRALSTYSTADLQELRAAHIGFIFQTFHLIDSLDALENILLVMKFPKLRNKEARKRALWLMEQFGIAHLIHDSPGTMSQGEKQRVAVARALANDAELIIADEPTGSLSTEQGMQIVQMLHAEVQSGKRCVVIASHDQRIAAYASRVLYIRDGSVSEQAPGI